MGDDEHAQDTQAKQDIWDHAQGEAIAKILVNRGWLRRGNTFQKPNAPMHYTIAEAVESELGRGFRR
jgi:hypothetical protein